MLRSNFVMVLEITPTTPLTHGAGNNGNEQILRTQEYLLQEPDPEIPGQRTWRRVRIPVVSGSAMKSALREHAFGHKAEILGLPDGSVDRDKLRLLLKGGKNDSGGQSVSLEEHRRLRDLFPMLAVFGCMDGGMPIRGQIEVDPVRPWCTELVDAGYLPRTVSAVQVSVDGEELIRAPQIAVYPDVPPVPAHMIRTEVQYYRHDLRQGPHVRYLPGATVAAIEDKVEAIRQAQKIADRYDEDTGDDARKARQEARKLTTKDERRDANESMPHAYQAIAPGTPMLTTIRLKGATDVEWGCLMWAVTRWVQHGARLGGGATKGHGTCNVRIAGAMRYRPEVGEVAAPGTAISVNLDTPEAHAMAYVRHIQERAEAIRAELSGVAAEAA